MHVFDAAHSDVNIDPAGLALTIVHRQDASNLDVIAWLDAAARE